MDEVTVTPDYALSVGLKGMFVVQVTDDSMVEYSLCEGDILLVKESDDPDDGDIAVVSINGECCLRQIRYVVYSRVSLLAGNTKVRSRTVRREDLVVYGVVKGVFRAL